MSLAAATRSETTKQFTTSIWWILAIVLVAYVGFTAAVLGFVFTRVGDRRLAARRRAADPRGGSPADALQHRDGRRLRVPAAHRHADGDDRVPPQDPDPDVPRDAASAASCSGRRSLVGIALGVLFGVIGVARLGRAGGRLPRRATASTPTSRSRRHLGAVRPHDPRLRALGARSASASARSCATRSARSSGCWCSRSSSSRSGRAAAAFVEGLSDVTRFLPGAASDALVGASVFTAARRRAARADPLEWWAGGLVLLGYAVVLVVLGHLVSWRRDVS